MKRLRRIFEKLRVAACYAMYAAANAVFIAAAFALYAARSAGMESAGSAANSLLRFLVRLLALRIFPFVGGYRVQVRGLENAPSKPSVYAFNHISYLDPLFALAIVPNAAVVVKGKYDSVLAIWILTRLFDFVSIGGGSPIDAAKAMWTFYEYPDVTFEDLCIPFNFPTLRTKAKFCAIPSTSGTATEVTAFSVITDYAKGIKYPLADFNITPDVAIVDPALAETMPAKLTAHTGMDAMTHAIEAYVSTLNCEYTDPLALHAIELIHDNLKKSYEGDMACRDKMHDAQCLAGMAFSNALLGIVHSMAHKTGAAFTGGHIIHGCANAMYLPKVIKYNSKDPVAAERYAKIAKFINLKGETTEELVDALIAELRSMNDQLNIPQGIKNYGPGGVKADESIIDEKEFLEKLPEVAKNAIADACTGSNPRQPNQEEMEKLLKACYYDTEIDF